MDKADRIQTSAYHVVLAYLTGVVGYTINDNSIGWGIIDAILCPLPIIKWVWHGELTLSLIKKSFPFFFQ